jgi:hypothetical protein
MRSAFGFEQAGYCVCWSLTTVAEPTEAQRAIERSQEERTAERIRSRARISIWILLVGVGVVMVPWLGTMFILMVGWIPLLGWLLVGLSSLRESLHVRRSDLYIPSVFTSVVPIIVYVFHMWVISHGP